MYIYQLYPLDQTWIHQTESGMEVERTNMELFEMNTNIAIVLFRGTYIKCYFL